jgi:inositol transport system ATP-binding protein
MHILQVTNLSKSYSGIKALDNVQLSVKRGEVHALMGENGAGKSTFMKILIGLVQPDAGEIVFDGNRLKNDGINDKLRKGISMIHQEILIIPELTVAQNIFLGREREITGSKIGLLNDRTLTDKAAEILARMDLDISPNIKMKYLSVAQMQMVEIAKAISNNASVIIMDEPTSAISDKEVSVLFRIIGDLKKEGVAMIYISHKMDEIFKIADSITVLRDGKYIGTKSASELDRNSLIALMVGREIGNLSAGNFTEKGKEILSVQNLSRKGKFSDISFNVRAGEIMGIAGLMGAGRTEIARVICGLDQPDSGEIFINGTPVVIKSPGHAMKLGIGYVSEDRKGLGFIPDLSVQENITLSGLPQYSKGIFINEKAAGSVSRGVIRDLNIKVSGTKQKVVHLSGGNQQKVVIAKVLLTSPEVIIMDEPTRGIDVGAKFEIYKLIRGLSAKGIAIIMISSELPEILGLSDRIMVLSKGKQTAMINRGDATQEMIMQYAVQ